MISRQQATTLAIEWAEEAELQHPTNPARIDAVGMATMWARIAPLLPATLDDDQLLTQPTPKPQCPSRHRFTTGEKRCERRTGHSGIHAVASHSWPNTPNNNAPANTGNIERHPDCANAVCAHPHCGDTCPRRKQASAPVIAPVPGQRRAVDDQPPRCQSWRDGQRCERAEGHPGIHQGVTCGWRNDPAAAAAESTAPAAWLCCQQAVVRVAEQLLQHARTAPGMTDYERRCLEDAADFVRAHMPAATPERENAAPQLEPPSSAVILAARHLDPTEGVSRFGHCLSVSDVSAITTVLAYVSRQHNAKDGRS